MLRVQLVSGEDVVELSRSEVYDLGSCRALKQHLQSLTRRSRFRQRLVAPEGILNEEETLEGLDLPCDLQLVLLPFVLFEESTVQELLAAAAEADLRAVEELLRRPLDPDVVDRRGKTALCTAALRGHVEVVSLLLEALADADRPRKFDGATPLFLAAGRGFAAVVRRLLLAGGRQERGNRQGLTPLLTAAEKGHLEVVQTLLEAYKGQEIRQATASLCASSFQGHRGVVRLFLEAKVDQERLRRTDVNGETPLFVAAKMGHREIAMDLLRARAAIEQPEDAGDSATPLLVAARKGHVELLELLLDSKADVERASEKDGFTPLLAACHAGQAKAALFLIQRGADVRRTLRRDGSSCFLLAAEENRLETVRVLWNARADLEKPRAVDDMTPLTAALRKEHLRMARALVRYRADLNRRNRLGVTPLLAAATIGRSEVVRLLVDEDADLELMRHDGASALWIAVGEGHHAVVSHLLTGCADCDVVCHGTTPLLLALQKDLYDTCRLLIIYGADAERPEGSDVLPLAVQKGAVPVVEALLRHASWTPQQLEAARVKAEELGQEAIVAQLVGHLGN